MYMLPLSKLSPLKVSSPNFCLSKVKLARPLDGSGNEKMPPQSILSPLLLPLLQSGCLIARFSTPGELMDVQRDDEGTRYSNFYLEKKSRPREDFSSESPDGVGRRNKHLFPPSSCRLQKASSPYQKSLAVGIWVLTSGRPSRGGRGTISVGRLTRIGLVS